jgi:hypothetical protein
MNKNFIIKNLFYFFLIFIKIIKGKEMFGHSILHLFQLQKGYINLNHGSYGSTPIEIIQEKRKWEDVMENNPDYWFRYQLYQEIIQEKH